MANTTLDEIADLMLSQINDYKINSLHESSGSSGLNDYLQNFLLLAIPEFDQICDQALTYTKATQSFSVELTQKNQNILSRLMVLFWLQKEVHDVYQMSQKIFDSDFKHYSEAQNLRAKQDLLSAKKEEIDIMLSRYGYIYGTDWTEWVAQDFA